MAPAVKPLPTEVPDFYRGYLEQASGGDLMQALHSAKADAERMFGSIDEAAASYRYAPGKWSLKELLQHLIDSERIFAYRALRIARGDAQPLPGFDEDAYAAASAADARSWEALRLEYGLVSASSIVLFEAFTPMMLGHKGVANGAAFSVEAIGWIIAGHVRHHLGIIEERYIPAIHGT